MSLWDIIRDFFVKYIFGGCTSFEEWSSGVLGYLISFGEQSDILAGNVFNSDFYIELPNTYNDATGTFANYISIGDYLSTTATIIVMVLLCFLLVKLAIWIFKLGANLIRLR